MACPPRRRLHHQHPNNVLRSPRIRTLMSATLSHFSSNAANKKSGSGAGERYVQTYPGCTYMLPADEEEAKRLRIQHDLLKKFFGGLIFAPITLSPGDKVLDCGTGSGIWPVDLHFTYPHLSLSIHGIDIETSMFPLPPPSPNLHFMQRSLTSLPTSWSSSFTLIQQRFLGLGLKTHEWPLALSEMYRILRPGGYIQLIEAAVLGPPDVCIGPKTDRLHTLMMGPLDKRKVLYRFYNTLPGLIEQAGFVNVKTVVKPARLGKWAGQEGEDALFNFINVDRAMRKIMDESGAISAEEWDRLCDEVEEEWNETEGAHIDYMLYVAQKPSV